MRLPRFLPVLALLAAPVTFALPGPGDSSSAPRGHRVVVLDPVDLQAQAGSRPWGDSLRAGFASLPGWRPVPLDSMEEKFRENKRDFAAPCHEYQCAFDAGVNLLSEFVVFGTVTRVHGWFAYTLDLVHVASAQAVWAKTGEIRVPAGGDGGAALGKALRAALASLNPDSVRASRRAKRWTLTILDLGEPTAVSRVVSERVATHLRATLNFTLMNPIEQDELLAALEIDKAEFSPTDSGIYWLGGKLGVTHIVHLQISGKEPKYRLGLAFYDMEDHRKALDWPPRDVDGFGDLAKRESDFFAELFTPVEAAAPAVDERRWFLAGAGLGAALSAGMAVVALQTKGTPGRVLFGGLSGVFLAGAGVSFALSF